MNRAYGPGSFAFGTKPSPAIRPTGGLGRSSACTRGSMEVPDHRHCVARLCGCRRRARGLERVRLSGPADVGLCRAARLRAPPRCADRPAVAPVGPGVRADTTERIRALHNRVRRARPGRDTTPRAYGSSQPTLHRLRRARADRRMCRSFHVGQVGWIRPPRRCPHADVRGHRPASGQSRPISVGRRGHRSCHCQQTMGRHLPATHPGLAPSGLAITGGGSRGRSCRLAAVHHRRAGLVARASTDGPHRSRLGARSGRLDRSVPAGLDAHRPARRLPGDRGHPRPAHGSREP